MNVLVSSLKSLKAWGEEVTLLKVELEKRWKEFNEQAHKSLTEIEKSGNDWIAEFDKTEKNLEKMIADTQTEIESASEEAK